VALLPAPHFVVLASVTPSTRASAVSSSHRELAPLESQAICFQLVTTRYISFARKDDDIGDNVLEHFRRRNACLGVHINVASMFCFSEAGTIRADA